MPAGSFAFRRLMEFLEQSRDAFDRDIALGTTNEADLAGHYPFSPERFRLSVNGNRQFIQYDGEPPEYDDTVDGHRLTPQSAGDVVRFETTERYRYVVQFVTEWSLSLALSQSLAAGEIAVVGFGDPDLENATGAELGPAADGWFVFQTGADADDEATLAEVRAGTIVDSTRLSLRKLFQIYGRLAGETNWYNVGNTAISETSTGKFDGVESAQNNETVGRVAADDARGPETANKRVVAAVKAESGAGSLSLFVGSIGVRTLGDVDTTVRTKTAEIEAASDTAGTWDPIAALRVDPDRSIVATQLTTTEPTDFTGSASGRVAAFVVDASKTDASGFSAPPSHSSTGSVIEQTTSVSTFPDATGSVVSNTDDPGGYQIGYGSLQASGSSGKAVTSTGREKKQTLPGGDVIVIAAESSSTGTWTIEHVTEQDW